MPWPKGKPRSEETKRKISKSGRGLRRTEETKRKIGLANAGKVLSPTTRKKISEAHKGKELSSEHRESIGAPQRGEKNHMYGKKHSAATRKKISRAMMGNRIGEKNHMFGQPPSQGAGRGIGSYSNKGHWVRSSWERRVADWLFGHDIEYEYEPERFVFNGGYSYRPDFRIPHLDLYIEVKGYMSPKNEIQHRLFQRQGHQLLILDDIETFDEMLSYSTRIA